MAHLVTGFSRKNHIKSADDGALNQAIVGKDCFVLEGSDHELGSFGAAIVDNNTVRIYSGEGIMYGRHFRIEPGEFEDLIIDNGQISMYRRDCIVATYEKDTSTGIESVYLEVIKGTPKNEHPALPTFETGNIYKGAVLCRMLLYDVLIDGVVLKSVNKLYKTQVSLNSLENKFTNEISEINSNLIQSASTMRSSDALHVDLNNPYGEANRPQMVFINESINMPTDCAWGIRTVYWLGSNSVCVQINGVTTDGNNSKIWTNCYNYGKWTGWQTPVLANTIISTDKSIAPIPTSGAYGAAPICVNALYSSGARAGIGLHNEGCNAVYLYLENDNSLYYINNGGEKFRINVTAV